MGEKNVERAFSVKDTDPGYKPGFEQVFLVTKDRKIIKCECMSSPGITRHWWNTSRESDWREVTRAEFRESMGWTAPGFPPALAWIEEPESP